MSAAAPVSPPQRLLFGPGPSEVAPSVLRALALQSLGHLDPALYALMDETRAMLRTIYGTANDATLALSGTGTSGMECALCNLIEPGDGVLVPVHGYFGARVAEISERCGASVTRVDGEWGRPSDPARARAALAGKHVRVVAVVHAETSTGVRLELAPWRELARELDALLVVDAVTSLGCIPVELDAHGVDAAWSCSQKGLSCTPGMSPVSFSPRALERIRARKRRPQSFYLDLQLLLEYWNAPHAYHHTMSSNLLYGVHEAARLVVGEGLAARFERHRVNSGALVRGIEALGLELLVPSESRLPQLIAIRVPDGVDDARLRSRLLGEYGIEIGGGLGPLKGRLWRIGVMGHGATRRNVTTMLAALQGALAAQGVRAAGDPLEAADSAYAAS